MPYTPVESSNLRGVNYDPASQVLTVDFKSGSSVKYANVPQDEVDALCSAPSAGKHFNQFIKDSYDPA